VFEQRSKDGGSPIGGSVFYAESCRESSSSKDTNNSSLEESSATTLWIGSSTHSCSKITVIDGNSPQKVLECFVLCSSHLLCIAAVPGVSEDDFDDNTKENDESEISYDSAGHESKYKVTKYWAPWQGVKGINFNPSPAFKVGPK
jgi:hypothetical protein